MRRTELGLALALLATAGCGPFIDEVNGAHRGKVEAKLEEIRAVGKKLADTPAIEGPKTPPGSVEIVLGEPRSVKGNAALLYAEDFANLDELGFVYGRIAHTDVVPNASAFLHTEREPWNPATPETIPTGVAGMRAEGYYAVVEGLDHLAVIRTRAFAKPLADAAGPPKDAGADASELRVGFSGGYLDAELLLFRLSGAELVGGTRFQAESSESWSGDLGERVLESDFRANAETALVAAAERIGPNVKVKK